MERIAGPVIAIFLIAAIGGGVYAYSLHGQLNLALAAQAAAEKKATQATQATQANQATLARMNQGTTSLTTCQIQLQEATNRADAAEQAMQTAQSRSAGGNKKR